MSIDSLTQLYQRSDPVGSAGSGAIERLRRSMRLLQRACLRQRIVQSLYGALLVSLLLCSVVVLIDRSIGFAWPSWVVCLLISSVLLLFSVIRSWLRRPDRIQVAIAADLNLRLSQKLSTAVEFDVRGTDSNDRVLAERLAQQVGHDLGRLRPDRVFQLALDNRARLLPLAILLLGLSSMVELSPEPTRLLSEVDPTVSAVGEQLLDHAMQMRSRAMREQMQHSVAAASDMQRLGERMQAGKLGRNDALSRLRDLTGTLDSHRRAALSQGGQRPVGPLEVQRERGAGGGQRRSAASNLGSLEGLRARLQALRDGAGADASRAMELSDAETNSLSELGVDANALSDALSQLAQGDSTQLDRLLEDLNELEKALREAQQIEGAQAAVDQALQSLGEKAAGRSEQFGGDQRAVDTNSADVAGADGFNDGSESADFGDEQDFAGKSGRAGFGNTRGQTAAIRSQQTGAAGDLGVLQVQGRPGTGDVFSSEARVLPSLEQPRAPVADIAAQYTPQLEAVLARESYPPSYKRFVKDYFLGLSGSTQDERAQRGSAAPRSAPTDP